MKKTFSLGGKRRSFEMWEEQTPFHVATSLKSLLDACDGTKIHKQQVVRLLEVPASLVDSARNYSTEHHPEWLIEAHEGWYHICRQDSLCAAKWTLHGLKSSKGSIENMIDWADQFEFQYKGDEAIARAFHIIKWSLEMGRDALLKGMKDAEVQEIDSGDWEDDDPEIKDE